MKYLHLAWCVLLPILATAQLMPCDTLADCYPLRCQNDEKCLCDSLWASGQRLRYAELYADAVKRLKTVALMCPDRKAQAVIDSIYREHRIWVYQDGKFAVATPLGEPITPFQFSNPEPFRKGVAIFSENGKYFFVNKDGKVLTLYPGYDGIVRAEGNLYYLIRPTTNINGLKEYGVANLSGNHFPYWKFDKLLRPFLISEFGPWKDIDSMKVFLNNISDFQQIRTFAGGRAVGSKNGEYYILNSSGNQVFSLKCDYMSDFHDGVSIFDIKGKKGIIDTNGIEIISPQIFDIDNYYGYSEGLAEFSEKNKRGFIDKSGKIAIPPIYDYCNNFFEGKAAVSKNDKWGFIDKEGKEIIALQYEGVGRFVRGRTYFKKDGKWGIIDANGTEIAPAQYDKLDNFVEGLAWATKDGKSGLVDTMGQLVIPLIYENPGNFIEGFAWVSRNGKYTYINRQGKEVTRPNFTGVWVFQEGKAGVCYNSKWGFIDTLGRELIPFQYEEAQPFQNGLAAVKKNGEWIFIDNIGTELRSPLPAFEDDKYLSHGITSVKKDGKWGIVNGNGELLLPPYYDEIQYFNEGMAAVKDGDFWGFIDTLGQEVVFPQYEYSSHFEESRASVSKNGKYGYIDKSGKEIIEIRFETASNFGEGLASVKVDTQTQVVFIDTTGVESMRLPYDYAEKFIGGLCLVSKGNYCGFIDKNGNEVLQSTLDCGSIAFHYALEGIIGYKVNNKVNLKTKAGDFINIGEFDLGDGFKEGMCLVHSSSRSGFIDMNGVLVIPIQYEDAFDFENGTAWVKKGSLWGKIDKTGQIVLPFKINAEILYPFRDDMIVKTSGKEKGVIDSMGKELVPCILDRFHPCAEHTYLLYRSNKKGLLFADEKTYITPEYDEIANPRDPWVLVQKNGKWGWVDHRGNVIIPCRFDAATQFNTFDGKGYATVLQFGLQFRINSRGEMIWRMVPDEENKGN